MKWLTSALIPLLFAAPAHAGASSLASERRNATKAEVAFLCELRSADYVADFEAAIIKDHGAEDQARPGIDATYRQAYDTAAVGCDRSRIKADLPALDRRHRLIAGGRDIDMPRSAPLADPRPFRAALDLAQSNIYPAFLAHRCGLRSEEWAVRVQFETIGKQRELEIAASKGAAAGASGIPLNDDMDRADGLAVGRADVAPRRACRLVTRALLRRLGPIARVSARTRPPHGFKVMVHDG